MEAVKRKRETSSSIENSPDLKRPKAGSTDALAQLLDFSTLENISAISDRFDQVASDLLHDYILVVGCGGVETEFKILELEFYLQKHGCHEDPFTHGSEEQEICGRWCSFSFSSQGNDQLTNVLVLGISIAHPDDLPILTEV
jgi:hypothetical protein